MTRFHDELKSKMDTHAHLVYKSTREFPREEIYGITSQLRRAALSVVLNYIEGYARIKDKVLKYFLGISYSSLKESKYLLHFSLVEGYISEDDYKIVMQLADDIWAMLWGTITGIETE